MNNKTHIMHITYDMRIGGTEMVIKNIIDGLHQPQGCHSSELSRHSTSDASRHSSSHLGWNPNNVGRTLVRQKVVDQNLPAQSKPDSQQNISGMTVEAALSSSSTHESSSSSTHEPSSSSAPVEDLNLFTPNFKMSILCIESPLGPFAQELQEKGIEFFQLNRQPGFDTNLIKQIRLTIKTNKVDIIHCHQYTPWVYGVIAAAFTKTKVIFTEHGRFYPDSSTWKRKLINPILNLFTDQVTAISKATKQALVEFENIPEKSIDVIYNGIKPLTVNQSDVVELRLKLNIPGNHLILGTIARFDPIKNHTMMLKAFAIVLAQQPNTTLIIVGDGEERANIETCINKLNIKNNVILTGYQTKPQNYLALMDIYLLSSFSEGTSMTLLEAMSLGKPCVVTDVGGNPEVVINEENGFVTPNDNADTFAKGVTKVISSLQNNDTLGQASKNRFESIFSEKSMNKQYKNRYNM